MDLSYLYHRHGISLLMAQQARCEESREAHREFAAGYAARINAILQHNIEAAA